MPSLSCRSNQTSRCCCWQVRGGLGRCGNVELPLRLALWGYCACCRRHHVVGLPAHGLLLAGIGGRDPTVGLPPTHHLAAPPCPRVGLPCVAGTLARHEHPSRVFTRVPLLPCTPHRRVAGGGGSPVRPCPAGGLAGARPLGGGAGRACKGRRQGRHAGRLPGGEVRFAWHSARHESCWARFGGADGGRRRLGSIWDSACCSRPNGVPRPPGGPHPSGGWQHQEPTPAEWCSLRQRACMHAAQLAYCARPARPRAPPPTHPPTHPPPPLPPPPTTHEYHPSIHTNTTTHPPTSTHPPPDLPGGGAAGCRRVVVLQQVQGPRAGGQEAGPVVPPRRPRHPAAALLALTVGRAAGMAVGRAGHSEVCCSRRRAARQHAPCSGPYRPGGLGCCAL